MLVRVLEELGVFVGWRLDQNREAKFFTKLNDWALRQANASWDDPSKVRHLAAFQRSNVLRVLRESLRGIRRLEYLGPGKFLRYPSVEDLDTPWVMKDPRNTFTVDLWKEIFPAARILHVHRHPVDVAQSLYERERVAEERFECTLANRLAELALARRPLYGGSARVRDRREGVRLWEEYLLRVDELERLFGSDLLHVAYEGFVAEPDVTLARVASFCGLAPTAKQSERAVARVRQGRAYAFQSSPELVELCDEVRKSEIVRKWGYDKAPARR